MLSNKLLHILLLLSCSINSQAQLQRGVDFIEVSSDSNENLETDLLPKILHSSYFYLTPQPKLENMRWAKFKSSTEHDLQFWYNIITQAGTAMNSMRKNYDFVEWTKDYDEVAEHVCKQITDYANRYPHRNYDLQYCKRLEPEIWEDRNIWVGAIEYKARLDIYYNRPEYGKTWKIRKHFILGLPIKESCDQAQFPVGPIKISETQSICMASKYEDLLDLGEAECMAGNPVNVATGNKYQAEVDAVLRGYAITRDYNSTAAKSNTLGHFGMGWNSGFNKQLTIQGANLVLAHRDSGKLNVFEKTGSGQFKLKNQPQVSLKKRGNKYHYADAEWKETYDANGKLLSFTKRGTAGRFHERFLNSLRPLIDKNWA